MRRRMEGAEATPLVGGIAGFLLELLARPLQCVGLPGLERTSRRPTGARYCRTSSTSSLSVTATTSTPERSSSTT
jgi:hypothetical protein